MEDFWSPEIDSILSVGRSLEALGIRNWALEPDAALMAVDNLSVIGVPILGGDVYVVAGAHIEMNYDNWYCNRNSGETVADFALRSAAKAKSYIVNYPNSEADVLFAIVPLT